MIIDKNNVEDILSLGHMQSGMLYHYLIDQDSEHYFEQLELHVSGELDYNIFERTWKLLIKNNEMLRTVYRWKEIKNPVQIILKEIPFQLSLLDISFCKDDVKCKRIAEIKEKDKTDKFDLEYGPLIRVYVCKLEDNRHLIIISNHHIIYDGWSTGLLLKECFESYEALKNDKPIFISPKAKYKDYLKWLSTRRVDEYKAFWNKYLENINVKQINVLNEVNNEKLVIKQEKTYLSDLLSEKIKEYARIKKTTISTILNISWGILLQRYCDNDEIIFGTTVSGRVPEIKNLDKTVGLFINTIPLRIEFSKYKTIDELFKDVDLNLVERSAFENTELVNIKEWCGLKSNENLFDTVLVIENYPLESMSIRNSNSLSIEKYSISESTNYDLLTSIELNDNISITLNYNSALYNERMMKNMLHHFINIVNEICVKNVKRIKEISILGDEEKGQIISEFNTVEDYPSENLTIDYLFEQQVKNNPDAIALIYEDRKLTYNELNNISNQLAKKLQRRYHTGSFVGIMLNRSFKLIITMLAVLKAGLAYIPVDFTYPKNRIEYILKDSDINILITEKSLLSANTMDIETDFIFIDDIEAQVCETENVNKIHNSQTTAYCVYTSGSSGNPKGVIIKHASIVNTLIWRSKYYKFDSNDIILQVPSFSFDSSVEDIFTPLISGSKLVIMNEFSRKDPAYIKDLLIKHKVSHFLIVPSMYRVLLEEIPEALKKLKFVTIAGELCTEDIVHMHFDILKDVDLYNEYGPSENSVCTTVKKLDKNTRGSIIGKPINNTQCFILSKNNLQPIGVAGELCISGKGLAEGYLHNIDLTKEKFIQSSSINGSPKRIYRTGDLARWLPNGDIEFLGRVDEQVKIRGYRIEKGEIENLLLQYSGIKSAAVSVLTNINEKELIAYITSDQIVDIMSIREFLTSKLPQYYLPTYIIQIAELPKNPNGKVDMKILESIDYKEQHSFKKNYIEPKNDIEKKIEKIWCTVLNTEKVSVDSKFFDIGGNSLKIITLANLINTQFNMGFNISDIFKYNTIESIAKKIAEENGIVSKEEVSVYRY